MQDQHLSEELLLTTTAADLFFIPATGILGLTWKQPTTSDTIQEVYEHLILHMRSRQVKRILIDTRRRGRASYDDEVWMMQNVTPRLMQLFDSGVCLAYLLGPEHYAEVKKESPNGVMHSYSDLFRMKYFLIGSEALDWLELRQN